MFGFVSAMAMAAAFCFAGCANLFSFNGKFTKEERLVLDVGQELLPSDIFSSSKNVELLLRTKTFCLKMTRELSLHKKAEKLRLLQNLGI